MYTVNYELWFLAFCLFLPLLALPEKLQMVNFDLKIRLRVEEPMEELI